jgi:hypothetical protein
MTKVLSNPVVVVVLALLTGTVAGLLPLWHAADLIVKQAASERPEPGGEIKAQGWDFWTPEIERLSTELRDEKARLGKLATDLDQRSGRLAAERKEIDALRASLEGMRRELMDKVVEISADEAKNVRTLAQTYSSLSPKAVVAIFRELDDEAAVKILSLMKSDVVAPIFEEMAKTMGPDGTPLARRAAQLSDRLRLVRPNKPTPAP